MSVTYIFHLLHLLNISHVLQHKLHYRHEALKVPVMAGKCKGSVVGLSLHPPPKSPSISQFNLNLVILHYAQFHNNYSMHIYSLFTKDNLIWEPNTRAGNQHYNVSVIDGSFKKPTEI